MKDIFANLYNKVVSFFHQTENNEDNAKDVACNRLKLVLMQDRTNLTPKILEQMRGELIDLLSRYVELDKELLELNFEHEGDQVALMLSIPVIRAKDEEEIEATLKAEAEKLEAKAEEIKEAAESDEENSEEEVEAEETDKSENQDENNETSEEDKKEENSEEPAAEEESHA